MLAARRSWRGPVVFNFFEMMRAGQGNPGLDGLARQFGLSQDQALRASAALLPAFFLGLQRSAANPDVFANLASAFNAGPFASFFNDPAQPPPPQAERAADEMLGRIFGSAELTRRVAAQAATLSGVSAQIIQQMMPIMAAAVVGSLSKFSEIMREQASGQASAPAGTAPSPMMQPMAAWIEMMRALTGTQAPEATRPAPEPPPKPAANARPATAPDARAATSLWAENPWAEMALAMLGQPPAAARPEPEAEAEPEPEPEPEPAPSEAGPGGLAQLVESGREAQQQYLASLQRMFDQFWSAPDRR
jgi:hypothetical protein